MSGWKITISDPSWADTTHDTHAEAVHRLRMIAGELRGEIRNAADRNAHANFVRSINDIRPEKEKDVVVRMSFMRKSAIFRLQRK